MMLEQYIPHWLSWPASFLAMIGALGGCALMFMAAAFGEYTPAIWAAVSFVGAGAFWYLGDVAAGNRPIS
ncbi:hypothetical protein HQ535_15895 [bacterium]|nr:hypothetical protein [bacterium]